MSCTRREVDRRFRNIELVLAGMDLAEAECPTIGLRSLTNSGL